MARYTGPKARVSRRLGVNIWGTAGENRAMERRPYPPGEHGRSRRRNASEYLLQMQEKQKARFTYGLNERQFRNLYEECSRRKGVTGELMLQLLGPRPGSSWATATSRSTASASTSPAIASARAT
jgi:small subunit ribosomal protein S4